MADLERLDLRRRLCDLRRALIDQLASEPIEPGHLAALSHVQISICALDADAASSGPKERERGD
jgi:hypothetical protein